MGLNLFYNGHIHVINRAVTQTVFDTCKSSSIKSEQNGNIVGMKIVIFCYKILMLYIPRMPLNVMMIL